MICISSRDWQDFLDKQERIALALEKIAGSLDDRAKVADVTKDVLQRTADLQGAIPK